MSNIIYFNIFNWKSLNLALFFIIKNCNNMHYCIFTGSKYYAQAKADPLSIAPPLGYDFLSSKSKHTVQTFNKGQLQYKQVFDKPHHKIISQRKAPEKLEQFLKITDLPRKSQYLAPTFIDFMRNVCSKQIFLSISRHFVPNWKPEYSMIQLSQLISNPRIESLTHIQDYALSTFFFLCQGSDIWRMRYLHEFFNRKIIQYQIQCQVVNHQGHHKDKFLIKDKLATIFNPPNDIQNVEDVKKFIRQINQTNKKKDPLYSGVHLYFADFNKNYQDVDYFQRQVYHYNLLQYFITVMTGILGNGQTAIIKLCGTFKHKTFELLFLLKLIFKGKVSLCKPIGSNVFLPDSYITCEYYNKINGDVIHNYLLDHYHLLKQFNDQKLLLDQKKMLKEDSHTSLRNFNQGLIHRGIQAHLNQFRNNSNIEYYPSRQKLLQKTIKYSIDLQPLIRQMIKTPQKSMEPEQKQKQREKNWSRDKDFKNEDKSNSKNQANPANQVNSNNKVTNNGPKGSLLSAGLFAKKKNNTQTKN